MQWIKQLGNSVFLQQLFPSGDPSLNNVRLHEVVMRQDGPVVTLRIELKDYPVDPPRKWVADKCNTVHIVLRTYGVESLLVSGWSPNNIGAVIFKDHVDGRPRRLEFSSGSCCIAIDCCDIAIEDVRALSTEK